MLRSLLLACLFVLTTSPAASAQDAERTKTRLLYSFEDGAEATRLARFADNFKFAVVQDNGVTNGRNCLRLTATKGAEYASLRFDAEAIKNWNDFDYLAIDVFTEDDNPYVLCVELWDKLSKNYATRCTFGDNKTRPGRQTLLYPISKARRNSKEGRSWEELEPADKIDRANLATVKFYLTPLKDRDAVFWIDNVRLLQEDAARPKLQLALPTGGMGFKFASAGIKMNGFKTVSAKTAYTPEAGFGFTDIKGLTNEGEGWPDLLAGTFVRAPEGAPLEFRARVPNGEYFVWLCSGPIYRTQPNDRHFQLRVHGMSLTDETPTAEEYFSEKYLYRFLSTQYSEKPHALWNNYIDRMYPVRTQRISVTDGEFRLAAINHFVSAVVLVPVAAEKEYATFVEKSRTARLAAFEGTLHPSPNAKPKPQRNEGDGDFLLYEPDFHRRILPSTVPTAEERKRTSIRTAGAPGQSVTVRLAVVPFRDLGRSTLEVGDFQNAGDPAIRNLTTVGTVRYLNYRFDGETLEEMALMPASTLEIEKGLTQVFYVTLKVPAVPAGVYRSTWTFRPGRGEAVQVPVQLEVYPFTLEPVLPLSLGMYYNPRQENGLPEATQKKLLKEQLQWMRGIGFTAIPVGGVTVLGLGKDSAVRMSFDSALYDLAREVGMGRHPKQYLMGNTLGTARAIGRRLPGIATGAAIDRNPGMELKQPEFRGYFLNAMKQQKTFLDGTGLPVAVEICDEPRETPNPWNRNLADTITYAGLLHEAKLTTFVTPMADTESGKNYVVLADHSDILSVHGWKPSEGLITRTAANGKTLWLYNTGMDRFSWGFYCHRAGAEGRWEWHFCWPDDEATGGYPGREWYCPFTKSHGMAPYAPSTYPGGMLFQSCYVDVQEGISDYAYLYTLEKTLAECAKAGKHAETCKEAKAFLQALERAIPALPGTKGLLRPEDGALVGMGVDDEAKLRTAHWREMIAELLKKLQK